METLSKTAAELRDKLFTPETLKILERIEPNYAEIGISEVMVSKYMNDARVKNVFTYYKLKEIKDIKQNLYGDAINKLREFFLSK